VWGRSAEERLYEVSPAATGARLATFSVKAIPRGPADESTMERLAEQLRRSHKIPRHAMFVRGSRLTWLLTLLAAGLGHANIVNASKTVAMNAVFITLDRW
jgi:hypothetical protein